MQDLLAGQIDFTFGQAANYLGHVRSGQLKAFAVLSKKRWWAAPDVPTMDEAGVPGFMPSFWHGLWVPKGTPKEIIAKLNAAVVETLADQAVQKRLKDIGQEIWPGDKQTPEALAAQQKAEIERWWPIIKAAQHQGRMSCVERRPSAAMKALDMSAARGRAGARHRRAQAQSDYPNKPVKIIIDSAPGSATDVAARLMAERLSAVWGQQAIVDNRPGAGGSIAVRAASQAAPDGYTLYVGAASTFTALKGAPGVAPNLPIELPRDFAPIGFMTQQPMFIAVAPHARRQVRCRN